MEKIKRHIELAVLDVIGDEVTFHISEQTHRGEEFSRTEKKFYATNGITLYSYDYPQFLKSLNILCVRGSEHRGDYEKITVSKDNFAYICEAITEYNKTNGEGYGNLHPKDGEPYYYISSSGEIVKETYRHKSFDKKAYSFGNFFCKRAEAEIALEHVTKILKEKK